MATLGESHIIHKSHGALRRQPCRQGRAYIADGHRHPAECHVFYKHVLMLGAISLLKMLRRAWETIPAGGPQEHRPFDCDTPTGRPRFDPIKTPRRYGRRHAKNAVRKSSSERPSPQIGGHQEQGRTAAPRDGVVRRRLPEEPLNVDAGQRGVDSCRRLRQVVCPESDKISSVTFPARLLICPLPFPK